MTEGSPILVSFGKSHHVKTPLIAPSLAIAGALALLGLSVFATLFPLTPADESASISIARYLNNDLCFLILLIGTWAIAYGILQLYGSELEIEALKSGKDESKLKRRLTGAVEYKYLLENEGVEEPTLRASIIADRFDAHRMVKIAPITYSIWVLPLMGFIGTVIGISGAIGDLGNVFAEAGRGEALTGVLAYLRYAFDTTFVGLAMVIPTMALATLHKARSDIVRHLLVSIAIRT